MKDDADVYGLWSCITPERNSLRFFLNKKDQLWRSPLFVPPLCLRCDSEILICAKLCVCVVQEWVCLIDSQWNSKDLGPCAAGPEENKETSRLTLVLWCWSCHVNLHGNMSWEQKDESAQTQRQNHTFNNHWSPPKIQHELNLTQQFWHS